MMAIASFGLISALSGCGESGSAGQKALMAKGKMNGAFQEGRYQDAIQHATALLRINYKDTSAYLVRAKSYAALGQLDLAIEEYTSVLNTDSRHLEALSNRGELYSQKNNHPKAIQDWRLARQISQSSHEKDYLRRRLLQIGGLAPEEVQEIQKQAATVAARTAARAELVRLWAIRDVNRGVDGDGLWVEANSGNLDTVRLLLEAGVNVDARGLSNETALMRAAHLAQIEMAQFLIDKGADVNAKANNGATALMYAADPVLTPASPGAYTAVAELLLNRGADVNAKLENNITALTLAVKRMERPYPMVQLLLSRGADVNIKSDSGTALRIALHRSGGSYAWENEKIIQLLKSYGAKEE